jgi:transcription elongation factor GreB
MNGQRRHAGLLKVCPLIWIRPGKTTRCEKGLQENRKGTSTRRQARNYITRSGLQRLKDKHRFLLTRERPAVTEVAAWAASNGDRSENADYQYGKRRLQTATLI